MSIKQQVEKFYEGIEKLKKGKLKLDRLTKEEQETCDAFYKQGISDVLSMIEGHWKKELTGVTLNDLLLQVQNKQKKICAKEYYHEDSYDRLLAIENAEYAYNPNQEEDDNQ